MTEPKTRYKSFLTRQAMLFSQEKIKHLEESNTIKKFSLRMSAEMHLNALSGYNMLAPLSTKLHI